MTEREAIVASRKADGFCDRIIRELADGKRRKSPPLHLLVNHLMKRGRMALDFKTGLFVGLMSNGSNLVLAGLIPESQAITSGDHLTPERNSDEQ